MLKTHSLLVMAFSICILIGACGGKQTETPGYEAIQTVIGATVSSAMTQTARSAPAITPATPGTPAPPPTILPPVSVTPLSTQPTATPLGCHKLKYLKDVTIPDNSILAAGQTFTKTWLVQNNGTCTWEAGFKLAFLSGEQMGASSLTLSKTVSPGSQVELSVVMVVPPDKSGKLTGIWKMTTSSGGYFGEPLTVVIYAGGTTTPTAAITPTASSQPEGTLTESPPSATAATPTTETPIQATEPPETEPPG